MVTRRGPLWSILVAAAAAIFIESPLAMEQAGRRLAAHDQATAGQRTTWSVDSLADTADSQPGDGLCAAGTAGCTLRAAIQEANARSGPDAVTLPAGHFVLTLDDPGGRSSFDPVLDEQTGDVDVRDTLAIEGAGADATILDGDLRLPILHVHRGVGVTVRGVGFTLGSGTSTSGGCLWTDGPTTVDQATFVGCVGRAVQASQPLTVTASHFDMNGVAIASAASLVVRDTSFDRQGNGAIRASGPTWIDGATFVANRATVGAALDASGDLTVRRSTFEANSSTSGALAYRGNGRSVAEISDSAFISNTATSGAAIDLSSGRMVVTNSTFAANSGTGSSVISTDGTLTLTHVTLHGGALYVMGGGVVLHNTLFAGARCALYNGTIVSLGHNIESSNTCGLIPALGDQVGVTLPPMALRDNGGPTLSMMPGPAHPALDAADPAACTPQDQRGYTRPAGSACDVGAVERGAVPGEPAIATPPPAATAAPYARNPTPTTVPPGALPATLTSRAHIGGAVADIVVWGDRAARASGTTITLLDLADPDAPRELGRLAFDTLVTALAGPANGGDLVALTGGDLVRVDVSDPLRPTIAGAYPLPVLPGAAVAAYSRGPVVQRPYDVTVSGTVAVVALVQERPDASRIHDTSTLAAIATIDLARPDAGWQLPWQSGATRSPYVSVLDVAASDARLFAVLQPEEPFSSVPPTIVVVDRAGGASGTFPIRAWDGIAATAPDGRDLWLAAEPRPAAHAFDVPGPRGLLRLDAADAAAPRLGVTVTLAITIPLRGLVLRDRTAWLLAGTDVDKEARTELLAVDVSAPGAASAAPAVAYTAYGRVLAGDGDRLLVGDGGGWVRVVTTADDRTGVARGEVPDVGPVAAVEVAGGRLLAGGPSGAAGLTVVDVAAPDAPRWTASWGRMPLRGWPELSIGLAAEGDTAWVANGAGLYALDLSRPESPRVTRRWLRSAKDVVRFEGRTWVVGQSDMFSDYGLLTADVDGLGEPRVGGPWFPAIRFEGVAAGTGGRILAIVDQTVVGWVIDDGGDVRSRSVLDLGQSPARGWSWSRSRACCAPEVAVRPGLGAAAAGDVTLFDPAPTAVLRILGSIQLPSRSAEGVALHGDLAVVAAGYDGVVVVDVRAPERPAIVAWYDTPGYARRVALDWPLIYVADSDAGIAVLRYASPDDPPEPSRTPTPPAPTGTPMPRLRHAVWLPLASRM